MTARPTTSSSRRTPRTAVLVAAILLTVLAAGCSSDSGSTNAATSTSDAVATTSTVSPGAELQGAWTVEFTLDPTADNDPGDAQTVAEEFTETWTFTETADGCEPGDAGCLVNSRDGTAGDAKAVNTDGDGYVTDKTDSDDTFCADGTPVSIHSIRTFSVDSSGELTGTFHQVVTPDDPTTCAGFDGTYTFTGTRDDGATTTTSAP